MPTKPEETPGGTKTKAVRLKVRTVEMLEDVAEALSQPIWKVAERFLGAALAAEHKDIQPLLKRVRDLKAKTAEAQREKLREYD